MQVSTNNELGFSELIIEEDVPYEEDYQISMLRECEVRGLLKVIACGEDDKSKYIYDISGKKSLRKNYETIAVDEITIRGIIKELLKVLENIKIHMLEVNKIILNPEFIYTKGNQYYFTYLPTCHTEIREGFHVLTEFFVKSINYEDVDTVVLACGLHRATMEKDYDLVALLEEYTKLGGEKKVKLEGEYAKREITDSLWQEEEEELEEEEIYYYKERENPIMSFIAENPLKKLWKKEKINREKRGAQKKKEIWGDWDELIQQEKEDQ